jgi:hypothetical protein
VRRHVYAAEEVAALADLSTWAVYNSTRRKDDPLGSLAIRVGRRLLWPKTAVDRLLGIDNDAPEIAPARREAADIPLTRHPDQGECRRDLTDGQEQ